jgi:hypothetical protein
VKASKDGTRYVGRNDRIAWIDWRINEFGSGNSYRADKMTKLINDKNLPGLGRETETSNLFDKDSLRNCGFSVQASRRKVAFPIAEPTQRNGRRVMTCAVAGRRRSVVNVKVLHFVSAGYTRNSYYKSARFTAHNVCAFPFALRTIARRATQPRELPLSGYRSLALPPPRGIGLYVRIDACSSWHA